MNHLPDYQIAGPPDIDEAGFERLLQAANSPGAPEAAGMYGALVRRGVRPLAFLGFWNHESQLGTNAGSIEVRYGTRNPGAVRSIQNPEHGGTVIETDKGQFVRYATYEAAARDWADRLRGERYERASPPRRTVRAVTPVYAPTRDGNNPTAYADSVLTFIAAAAPAIPSVAVEAPPPYVAHTLVNVFGPPGDGAWPDRPVWPGRAALPVRALVLHVMDGTWGGSIAWARNPVSEASFHYGISKAGTIAEVVDPFGPYAPWANGVPVDTGTGRRKGEETDLPPHLGDLARPEGPNANWVTISIELEGHPEETDFPTEAQYASAAQLAAWLCARTGLAPHAETILPHRAFSTVQRSRCPGPRLDVGRLIAETAAWLTGAGADPWAAAKALLERAWWDERLRLGDKVAFDLLTRPWGDDQNVAKPVLWCRDGVLLVVDGRVHDVTGRALEDARGYMQRDGSLVAVR